MGVEMAVFARKQLPMRVERVERDGPVETFVGTRQARVGDWLVHGTGVAPLLVSDRLFRELYEPVDDEARALLEAS
jgi:hypothetical protein